MLAVASLAQGLLGGHVSCEAMRAPWRSRVGGSSALLDAAHATGVRPPWNAPRIIWKLAWKTQRWCIPLLHATDRLDLGRSLTSTNVNLDCLWWKAIQGDPVAFQMLPPISRVVVARPFRSLYPRLHHQNVAIRTAYLDAALGACIFQRHTPSERVGWLCFSLT